ncbi:MAG: MarR family transcriptional regulator [Clostridiales bacterium]|jgi:DNA-binding MarR family transcriptional regulator|nr:MarR family transcriptional regulator [Clostridiales bacterium]
MQNNHKGSMREVLDAYVRLNQTYAFCMQRTLQKYGLYEGQPAILFKLRELKNPNQNDIATALRISKSSAGISLRRLEKGGFIRREQDKADSRCNRIVLTKKGEEFAHWCDLDMDMMAANLMENFDAEERERVLDMLRRMQAGLENMRARIKSK